MTISVKTENPRIFTPENPENWQKSLYNSLSSFETFCIFNSMGVNSPLGYDDYEFMAGIDSKQLLIGNENNMLEKWDLMTQSGNFSMGFLSYELRHEVFGTHATQPATIDAPALFWFEPKWLILRKKDKEYFEIYGPEADTLLEFINTQFKKANVYQEHFNPVLSKSDYINNIRQIRKDIIEGDYYEMNFCTEFVSGDFRSSPSAVYDRLTSEHPVPFSAFMKHQNLYIICASPERFLKKKGSEILSQPMKGTVKRSNNKVTDNKLKQDLTDSEKDKAENIMIVDLVRSDLAKCCETGSIQVPELFGIYTYPTVHQMISTVTGKLKKDMSVVEIIRNTFPMGSMTGAPKRMVLERSSKIEKTQRGIYSGSMGYHTPEGDFDLNVIIRSLIIDQANNTASFHAGGAITFDSDPEKEYEEMQLKTKVWRDIFS